MKDSHNMLSCSIGVMAYNEEANIRFVLEALLNQRLSTCRIVKIVVVASGCTDQTGDIVRSIAESNNLVELIVQERRDGKASAINVFLSKAGGDVIVLESADTIPEEDAIENLVKPFLDHDIGMTGARPVPVDSGNTFMGFTAQLFWRLHHEVALSHPKSGELIAFRNIVREIPGNTAVDEASIEALITDAGYRIHYAKDAIVHNKGPETVRDFLRQRRRVTAGHKHLKATKNYSVSTAKIWNLLWLSKLVFSELPRDVKSIFWTFGAVLLEIFGRSLGNYDYYVKKTNPFAWDVAETTKNLKNDPTHS
jgi:biofilm PGA synthesis N-glycosyltransferase PgaC